MVRAQSRAGRTFLLFTAFVSGLSVMVMEMAAVRAMAPYFGTSTHIWTNVIGVVLGALAVGYFLGGRLADRRPYPAVLYGVILVGGLFCLGAPLLTRGVCSSLLPETVDLEGAFEHVKLASLIATLMLFAPPCLVLAGVSPMVIKLLVEGDRVGGASGRVFAVSTVGSIIGTFGTTLYLLPLLGTRMTVGCAGALLVVTAVAGFLLLGRSRTGLVVCAIGLLGGGVLANEVRKPRRLKVSDATVAGGVYYEEESSYQYIRVRDVVERGVRIRLLQFNEAESAYQSVRIAGSVLTGGRYYDYYVALPLLLGAPEKENLKVLVIGSAAGTIPVAMNHFFPRGLHVMGVEIDPAVVEIGHRYFGMPRDAEWLDVVIADGRVFLNGAVSKGEYDIIIIDAFAQEYYIPFHLATRETFERAREGLRDGGILAMNVSAFRPNEPLLTAISDTMGAVFEKTYLVNVAWYPNTMVFARKGREPDFRRLSDEGRPTTRDWQELLAAAGHIGLTARVVRAREQGAVLTDDHAPVERLTDETVKRESRILLGE